MSKRSRIASRLLIAVSACAFAMPGYAQTAPEPDTPPPAHLAYIDGAATLTRDGRAEDASVNLPIVSGDQLLTRQGRAEVVFGDGSVLDVDHFTTVDFLSDDLLRLLEGRVRLTIGGVPGRDGVSYRIDTPSGAVRIDEPGEYRVALIGESGGPLDVELITIRGFATLINDLGQTQVSAGQRAFASASMAPSYAQAFNSAVWDGFDRWAADRRDERTGAASARYLPEEIRGYSGAFDRYGDWRYEETYGYVWYPRVHVEWRPYSYGRWRHYRPWGWTWIAYDPWGWPTHHYGRWGFRAGLWFWVPARHWAPAYVYWASAPGYVGWCPLGWDGRPIFSIINVNIGIGRRGHGYYDPYRAWTVVPRHQFASRGDVREYAVPRDTLERAVPRWSLASAASPVRPESTTRSATPIYSAGRSYAVRRGAVTEAPAAGVAPEYRRQSPGGTVSESLGNASRTYRRTLPANEGIPRATPPKAAGVLGAPSASQGSRARDRILGPGGSTDARQTPESRSDRTGYAPRGVPDGGPGYAPRGVPRSGEPEQGRVIRENPYQGRITRENPYEGRAPNATGSDQSRTRRENPYQGERPGLYDRPVRRNPEYAPPSSPRSTAPDRPTYARPSAAPPARGDRPASSRPTPRGGGDRPSRAVPRGGTSGGPRPSSPSPQSGGGERARPRPR